MLRYVMCTANLTKQGWVVIKINGSGTHSGFL